MQLTVTCPECAGFESVKVENGATVQVFHACTGRVIRGEKERSEVRVVNLSPYVTGDTEATDN